MIILGIHTGHNGAACLVKDGKLVAALASERLSRQQKSHGISEEVLDYVFESAGVTMADVDCVALSDWNPAHANGVLTVQNNQGPVACRWNTIYDDVVEEYRVTIRGRELPVYLIGHQKCHCAAAYYTSNLDRSWCFSLDASGAKLKNNSLIALGEGNKLTAVECPNLMIGVGYGYFTEWLGIGAQMHKAGSTMGLAAYGKVLDRVLNNESYVNRAFIDQDNGHHPWMGELWQDLSDASNHFSEDRKDSEKARDIAATMQYLLEKCVLKAMTKIPSQPGDSVCLGGGTMLNCGANSAILNSGQFSKVHLFPACTDDGGAVGCALYVAHHIHNEPRYIYTDAEICYLGKSRTDEPCDLEAIAREIADGKVVGWCHGRSEYGPRALGNRSILADPRRSDYRDKINGIKRREWFRPFAPVVLEEYLHDWFDFPADKSPFMLFTAKVKQPEKIPAVLHVDGTARMQTINRETNPRYYDLVNEFYKITGVPILLNTSMNESGVPMVEREGDIESFWRNVPVDLMVVDGKVWRR